MAEDGTESDCSRTDTEGAFARFPRDMNGSTVIHPGDGDDTDEGVQSSDGALVGFFSVSVVRRIACIARGKPFFAVLDSCAGMEIKKRYSNPVLEWKCVRLFSNCCIVHLSAYCCSICISRNQLRIHADNLSYTTDSGRLSGAATPQVPNVRLCAIKEIEEANSHQAVPELGRGVLTDKVYFLPGTVRRGDSEGIAGGRVWIRLGTRLSSEQACWPFLPF